jgi:hypothetical protein
MGAVIGRHNSATNAPVAGQSGDIMRILVWLGVLFIVAWLVLWLAVKITFAAIHILVAVGVLMVIVALVSGRTARS